MVNQQTRKTLNSKCPEPDGVQGYWLKNFIALHERIATQVDDNSVFCCALGRLPPHLKKN